jgi:hypothetical protein
MAVVLIPIGPAPTVKLVSGITPPTMPPKVVVPAVAIVSALAPLIVDANVIAPVPVLVKLTVAAANVTASL